MYFVAQQSLIKHNCYYFENLINYGDNTNFSKQHKSTPNMRWLVSRDTFVVSHLEQEKFRVPKNRKRYILILQNEIFLTKGCHTKQVSVISCTCLAHRPF